MANVHISCPDCGDVNVRSREFTVVMGAISQYRFRCPRCLSVVSRDTEPRTVEMLANSGAEVISIDLTPDRRPIELPEIVDADDYCIGVHEAFQQWDPWTLFDATDGLV